MNVNYSLLQKNIYKRRNDLQISHTIVDSWFLLKDFQVMSITNFPPVHDRIWRQYVTKRLTSFPFRGQISRFVAELNHVEDDTCAVFHQRSPSCHLTIGCGISRECLRL